MRNEYADTIPTGTTTRTQFMLRAYLPDGRIEDSRPQEGKARDPNEPGRMIAEFFGRLALPKGTRFERRERTITITASEWVPVDPEEKPGA